MLGERLINARKSAGLSQDEVAKAIGLSQVAYSYIERNLKDPSLPVAKRIATTLGVSLDYLAGIDDKKK